MFDATEPTPARWANTGGIVTVHLVPAGTTLIEPDKGDYVWSNQTQETTPLCGMGVYVGGWLHTPELTPPLTLCNRCFPEGTLS